MLKSLNDITPAHLDEIKSLAALFFTPKEIMQVLEIDSLVMKDEMEDETSSIYRAFYTGRLQSEAELRKSIVKLAKSGSSPAQTMSMDLLVKSKAKMLER